MPYESITTKNKFLASEVGSKIIRLCLEVDEAQEFLANAFHGPKVRSAAEELSHKRAELRALLELENYI